MLDQEFLKRMEKDKEDLSEKNKKTIFDPNKIEKGKHE